MAVDYTLLKDFPCFGDLNEAEQKAIAEFSIAECFPEGYTFFHEGESGEKIYLLANGEVEVLYSIGDEGPVRVDTLGPGEILGCAALVPPHKYTATMRALNEVEVLAVDVPSLLKLMQEDCPVGFAIQQYAMRLMLDRILDFRLGAKSA